MYISIYKYPHRDRFSNYIDAYVCMHACICTHAYTQKQLETAIFMHVCVYMYIKFFQLCSLRWSRNSDNAVAMTI